MRMPQDATWLWKFLYALATLLRPLFCRLRVEGQAHIPSTSGCVVACNHTMGPDYFILGYASPRQIYYMAKIELFQIHPWFSRCLELVGTFPIARGRNDTAALGAAEALLRRGQVLGMFPEGTRSHTGELRRGKSGVARLAMATKAPVVPAVVINAEAIGPYIVATEIAGLVNQTDSSGALFTSHYNRLPDVGIAPPVAAAAHRAAPAPPEPSRLWAPD